MIITCPQCHFSREVTQDMLPKRARTATCPLCQHRFTLGQEKNLVQEMNGAEQISTPSEQILRQRTEQEDVQLTKQPANASAEKNSFEPVAVHPKQSSPEEDQGEDFESNNAGNPLNYNHAAASFAIENPWEQQKELGFFSAFFQTIARVCFAPARFFAGLSLHTPLNFAFVFYVIISVLQISIERFWVQTLVEVLTPMAANDPQLQELLSMFTPKTSYLHMLMLSTTFSLAELFIASGFYFFMFRLIAPQAAQFKLIFQITAYATTPVLLCIVPGIGSLVGFAWSIAVTAFGCRYALGLPWLKALLGILPFYLIIIPLLLRFVISMAL